MSSRLTSVLVVEDNPGDARLAQLALTAEHGFRQERADCLSGALRSLGMQSFDAVLLDLSLPDSQGIATLTQVRARNPHVPIVVITGLDDEHTALRSLDEGAQDYLVKGDEALAVVRRAISNAVQRQRIVHENESLLEELQRAKKSLEARNSHLSEMCQTAHEFVDNVSHEFRTPLTVIREYSSILRDGLIGEVNAEQCEYLEIIGGRVDDLARMVDDMLDMSKLEAGMLGVSREICSMSDVVGHVRATLERKAAASKVQLEIVIEDDLPGVYCDPEKIGRVIVNLTVNALKFSSDEGLVRLRARHDALGKQVVVEVSDDGRGIAEGDLSEIFGRFKQCGEQARGSTKGFGLGLSIAKELVHLNFGDITVRSELGRGSLFSFTVPVSDPSLLIVRHLERTEEFRHGSAFISLLTAEVESASSNTLLADVEQLIQHQLRRSDLTFRTAPHRWLLAVAADPRELRGTLTRLEQAWSETNRNRPSEPLPVLQLAALGTWPITDERIEFLERFEAELKREPENVHA